MKLRPNYLLYAMRLYDDTPQVVLRNVISERQRLLAQVRHNRLVDRFFSSIAYSLGSWNGKFRKSQVVIDEVYVTMNERGRQFVVPIQAQEGMRQYDVAQTERNMAWCRTKYPKLFCRPVSVQFVSPTEIAMFVFALCGGEIKVAEERHYELVPAKSVTEEDLKNYSLKAASDESCSV